MAGWMGGERTRTYILRNAGNISQIAGARSCVLNAGRGGGARAVEVWTGSGLEFTVLLDKCMDVYDLRYKGVNISFLSKAGLSVPQYFNPHGEFPYYFQGGMVATCGLRNVGDACVDEGEAHALHGRIGNAPAENAGVRCAWEGDEYLIRLEGDMREAALYRESMTLRRRISTRLGSNSLSISDRVENDAGRAEALMLLYHINFGFPFLGPGARLLMPKGTKTQPRDEESARHVSGYRRFEAPIDGAAEQCFYHETPSAPDGTTCALVKNADLQMGVYIRYNAGQLPFLTQWKCVASGDYALGIEPATCRVGGRVKERRAGTVRCLQPYGAAEFELTLGVLEGGEIDRFADAYGLSAEP